MQQLYRLIVVTQMLQIFYFAKRYDEQSAGNGANAGSNCLRAASNNSVEESVREAYAGSKSH